MVLSEVKGGGLGTCFRGATYHSIVLMIASTFTVDIFAGREPLDFIALL